MTKVYVPPAKKVVPRRKPILRFSPTAWAKLVQIRDLGDTEVGGFGVCPNNPLLVEYFELVKQTCTWAHVEFDDEGVADHFDKCVDAGLKPAQFARIWIHTHPGDSAAPSWTDEDVFLNKFGDCDWAVMFILAKGGETYARLQIKEPAVSFVMEVQIDYTCNFLAADESARIDWEAEYWESVTEEITYSQYGQHGKWDATTKKWVYPEKIEGLPAKYQGTAKQLSDESQRVFDQQDDSYYGRTQAEADAILDGYDPDLHDGLIPEDIEEYARLQRELDDGDFRRLS